MANTTAIATAYLGFGSNLGNRAATIRTAVHALDGWPRIRVEFENGVSSLYETSPVGGPSPQPVYLNSVVRVTTTLSPAELLNAALSIEASLGRARRERWEARGIDIDLLFYDNCVIDAEGLSLPHPRLHERRFVLEPLAEIAGDYVHPVLRVSIKDLASRVQAVCIDDTITRLAGPEWVQEPPMLAPHTRPRAGTA